MPELRARLIEHCERVRGTTHPGEHERQIAEALADLEAVAPDLPALDPLASFELADRYSSEQRWLTVGTVLLIISLFWFGMAELTKERARITNLFVGLGVYLFGVIFLAVVELVAFIAKAGAS